MTRIRLTALATVSIAALLPGIARAADSSPAFKTPGEAAYCQMEFTKNYFDAFRCFTPNDGWWIRFSGLTGSNVQITKGVDERYRGYKDSSFSLLRFGKTWWSSDADTITCWSRSTGLTCKQFDGLTFWIGRYRGYRIYVSPAGEKPGIAKPLFRTDQGTYCGVAVSMEPDAPSITCWRPTDGVELTLYHQHGVKAEWARNENAKGYRPGGYPRLPVGGSFTWRCSKVDQAFATGCSERTSGGVAIFTCRSSATGLECRSDTNHGFSISRSTFYSF